MEEYNLEEIREQRKLLQEKKDKLLEEKRSIEETTILKRYFDIQSEMEDVDSEIKKNMADERRAKYSLCDHDIIFLETYSVRRKKYNPNFRCIDCGKRISGAILRQQIVINENYAECDNSTYLGNVKDYNKLSKLYDEYKESGLETMQIAILLEGYLHEKYHDTKSVLKLIRK